LDAAPWHGFRRSLPARLFRRAGGVLRAIHGALFLCGFPGEPLPEDLSPGDELLCLGRGAYRNLHGVPVVSGGASSRHGRSQRVPAETPGFARHDGRLALAGDGMEGACAWLVPIMVTMAVGVLAGYGNDLRNHPRLKSAVLGAVLLSFVSAGIAGFWGAMINKYAPVAGGGTVNLMKSEAP
jgi:hypothetical protein